MIKPNVISIYIIPRNRKGWAVKGEIILWMASNFKTTLCLMLPRGNKMYELLLPSNRCPLGAFQNSIKQSFFEVTLTHPSTPNFDLSDFKIYSIH